MSSLPAAQNLQQKHRKTNWHKKVFWGPLPLTNWYCWFQTYLRTSAGRFKSLFQKLVPDLRRQSSDSLPRPTYFQYFCHMWSFQITVFYNLRPVNDAWRWETQTMSLSVIVADVVLAVGHGCDVTDIVVGWRVYLRHKSLEKSTLSQKNEGIFANWRAKVLKLINQILKSYLLC